MTTERSGDKLVPGARRATALWTALVHALILAFAATVPVWPYSVGWGDHPSELIGIALIAALLRILIGRA